MLKGLLTRKEQAVLIFVVASLFIGGAFVWWERHRPSGITVTHDRAGIVNVPAAERPPGEDVAHDLSTTTDEPTRTVAPEREVPTEKEIQPAKITINVAGAVNLPGVYKVPVGSVVEDAVITAGGYADNADPEGINRAARLMDGTTLNVPAKPSIYAQGDSAPVLKMPPPARNIPAYQPGSVPRAASLGGDATSPARMVNINTASSEKLQALPGIGPKTAAAIIEYRSKQPFMSIEDIQNVRRIGSKTFAGLKHLITVYEE